MGKVKNREFVDCLLLLTKKTLSLLYTLQNLCLEHKWSKSFSWAFGLVIPFNSPPPLFFLIQRKFFLHLDIHKLESVFFLLVGNWKNQWKCPLDNMKFRKLESEWFVKRRNKLKENLTMPKFINMPRWPQWKEEAIKWKKSSSDVHSH